MTVPATVHTTDVGTNYHHTADCSALVNGQAFFDADCGEDVCHHRHPQPHAIREIPLADAVALFKWPCPFCFGLMSSDAFENGLLPPAMIPPSAETFGHEPITYDGAVICKSCYLGSRDWHRREEPRRVVSWPCTSAYVLGLVPRPVQPLEGE